MKKNMIKIDIQRVRNLSTGILHTDMKHIHEDLEVITGEKGLMTHMLPRVMDAIKPWLKSQITDYRFWDDKFDKSHVGEIFLSVPTKEQREAFFVRYCSMPNPLSRKR